jgi:hypothetical protein
MNNNKKNEEIYKAIGNVDDELLERYEAHQKPASKKMVWIKWGAVAACACIVTVGALTLGNNGPARDNPAIVSSYNSGLAEGMFTAPENGKIFFDTNVKAALDKNKEKDTIFFVAINLYQNGTPLEPGSKEVKAELKRLTDSGYKAGYATSWTYQGDMEKVNTSYLAGYFTKEQLETFKAGSEYGYTFSFATNGDGSPVNAKQSLTSTPLK